MPRTSRASRGCFVYHVLNRGNGRSGVFHKEDDFAAFANLMQEAHEKVPMRLTGFCLMTNHFHLLLWPHEDGDLSRWMQWLMTSHVRRYRRHYKGSGHVWQGRFKAFPVQSDSHYLTVLRYVERNPLRAKMVERSWEQKPNSSRSAIVLLVAHRSVILAGRRELPQTSDWNLRFDRRADQNARISRMFPFAIPPRYKLIRHSVARV
ncbi:MAG TPA: transposase [Planctomycetaceae bacterium]|nr:transposase [Planctomycetaceae bacterium]